MATNLIKYMVAVVCICDIIFGREIDDILKRQNVINRRCFECHETDAPFKCLTLAKCGNDEICFTREFRDHNGRQGYHLGCEQKQRCELFQNAKLLLGKRKRDVVVEAEDDAAHCFGCCDADDCNAHLCLGSLAANSTHIGSGTCPPTFIPGPHSCFYVANWTQNWDQARLDCQRRGAELASVDDQSEDFFLVGLYNSVQAKTHPTGYWIGGYYITAIKSWAWLDMSKVTYSRWGPNQPSPASYQYRMAMYNPVSHAAFTDWMWSSASATTAMGFICERAFL